MFIKGNQTPIETYDIIYKHGPSLKRQITQKEFEGVFVKILKGLIFLEKFDLIYPKFDLQFVIEYEQDFVLINPMCSDEFF